MQRSCQVSTFYTDRKVEKLSPLTNNYELTNTNQQASLEPVKENSEPTNRVLVADNITDTVSPVQSVETETSGNLTCVNNTYGEGDERNKYITYTANKLIDNGFDNWKDILATFQGEGDWNPQALNTANRNGTFDKGICQLNSAYHKPFIESEEFNDPYKQIDYCVSVAVDARDKNRPIGRVWYAYANKHKHLHKFECTS